MKLNKTKTGWTKDPDECLKGTLDHMFMDVLYKRKKEAEADFLNYFKDRKARKMRVTITLETL